MRVRILVLLALAAAGAAATAAAGPTASTVQGRCGDKSMTVLLWPQGHKAIPAIGFPEFRTPHLEVYRYAAQSTYLPANQRGYVDAKGGSTFSKKCVREADQQTFQVLPARGVRTKAAITCAFAQGARVQFKKVAGAGARWEVRMIDGPNQLVLRAIIAPQGSHVFASLRQCAVGAAPG